MEGPGRRDRGVPHRARAGARRAAGARRLDGHRRPRGLPRLGGGRAGARRRPRHPPALEHPAGRQRADQRVPARRDVDGAEVAAGGLRPHRQRGALEGPAGRRRARRRHRAPDPRRVRRLPRRLGRGVRGAHDRPARGSRRRRRDGRPGPGARAAELPLDPRARGLARLFGGSRRRTGTAPCDRRLQPRAVPVRRPTPTAASTPGPARAASRGARPAPHVGRAGRAARGSPRRSATTTAPPCAPTRCPSPASTSTCSTSTRTSSGCTTTSCRTRRCGSCTTGCSTCRAGRASTTTSARRGTPTSAVNQAFADAVADAAAEGDVVLVQDYQLALVPGMLATRGPTSASRTSRTRRSADRTRSACCRRRRERAVRVDGGGAVRVPHRTVGRAYDASVRRDARRRPHRADVRGAARARPRRARRGRGSPGDDRRRADELEGVVGDRRMLLRSRPHRAVEEHRARVRRLRPPARAHPEWRERVVFVADAQPVARVAPRVPRVPPGGRAGRGPGQRAVGHVRLEAGRARHARRLPADASPGSCATTCCS